MDIIELEKIVKKVLVRYHATQISFEQSGTPERPHLTLTADLPEEDVFDFYEELQSINLYGLGWLMRNLLSEEAKKGDELIGKSTGKFSIEFERV
jgi:hypothetical protein